MSEVAIIGAGELGGAIAHQLARTNLVRAIRLIDDAGRVAAGKALDIAQAGSIEGHVTEIEGANDAIAAAGAGIVIIADRADRRPAQDDEFARLRAVTQDSPNAIVVCAGSAHADLVDRAVRELRIPAARVFGTAPEALTSAARALVALHMNGSPADVAITLLGVPPAHIVIPWGDATIGGFSAIAQISEPERQRISAVLRALWPPGPHALAAAAVKAVEAIRGRSRRTCACFVTPDRSAGVRARTAALPVRLGAAGIEAIVHPQLSVHERVALENAMTL
jgi:malate dehydrogenase